ncbi:diol dehydratase reactivase ATPase-like domain-containing protein [Acidothermaceae bacterium B102]|nr:diol dehydratase reactivase ATPase-like domain-containing protein [Acidothermaceae bacterium B102]
MVAGVDIGNATTEVVLVDASGTELRPLAWDRVVTRGSKGSPSSLEGAATLVRRLARVGGVTVDIAAVAPLRPVVTRAMSVPLPVVDTGAVAVLMAGAPTCGGHGFGAGRPVWLHDISAGDDGVVALVPRGTRFDEAARLIAALPGVRAVLVEADEAVLVANRLDRGLPVVDGVDVSRAAAATLVAVEVAAVGRSLQHVSDALALGTALGVPPQERADAARVAASLVDVSNAVVCYGLRAQRLPEPEPATLDGGGRVWTLGELLDAQQWPRSGELQLSGRTTSVDDVFLVDLGQVADSARVGTVHERSYLVASLAASALTVDPAAALSAALGLPVVTASSEAAAARLGALTTPGADPGSVVLDLGGGTIDLVTACNEKVAAGAGDLLTLVVSALLGVPRGAAEWVKRGPCVRLESPHLVVAEDGSRTFLDQAAPGDAVGSLSVRGPAGLVPFSRDLAVAEWRSLRGRAKQAVLAGNVRRLLDEAPASVVVVGGPAGDDEAVAVVARALAAGTPVGRGQVAGVLGHRYAAAYGLALGEISGAWGS